jgi:Flp pilus assembly pilin Flp
MLLGLVAISTMAAVQTLRDQIVTVFNSSASTLGSVK